jgi:hypothetical protein
VTLSFETGDAVDDIRCGLADGTTLWLQAKRACGADAQLKTTVVHGLRAGMPSPGRKRALARRPRGAWLAAGPSPGSPPAGWAGTWLYDRPFEQFTALGFKLRVSAQT